LVKSKPKAIKPTFFATAAHFRKWLTKHHASETELWVGFYKKATGKPSITYPEAVDQALCFGWIDGVRKSLDDESYVNRFTPRRTGSIWSTVNIKRAKELIELGEMQPAGAKAFAARDAKKTRMYSFERDKVELTPAMLKKFRANKQAWAFFQAQPPSYRKPVIWWVISAKQDATRERRLNQLIEDSARGERIGPMRRPEKKRS
jgi:uncharacterized protein YdeI (YjbR/CyaY-like superfamily)